MSSPFRETSLILECPKCETLNYQIGRAHV